MRRIQRGTLLETMGAAVVTRVGPYVAGAAGAAGTAERGNVSGLWR